MLEVDLANYPAEQRAEIYEKSKAAGIKVKNADLAAATALSDMQARGEIPTKALSLEFPGDMPDVRHAKEYFRVSTRKGFDILFDGLPIGPSYSETLEAIAKIRWKDATDPHIICHVFAAFAFPVREAPNKYGVSIVNPHAMNRVLPQKLREHHAIEAFYDEKEQRADAIWYMFAKVDSRAEQNEFEEKIRKIAMDVQTECATNLSKWQPEPQTWG